MRDRGRLELVLVVVMLFLVGSRLATILSELRLDQPGGSSFFDGRFSQEIRQGRFQAFEPGLLTLALAVAARFAPAGPTRRAAGWFCVVSAAVGLAAVAGIWVFEAYEGADWRRSDFVRVTRHLASLLLIGAIGWWGSEAIAAKPGSEDVEPVEIA